MENIISKKSSIVNKAIQYSLKKKSFQINKIQRKINKLLREKKNKDIPSKPKQYKIFR
jgi:hypothetical protein